MIRDYSASIIQGGSFKWAEYALLKQWNAYAIPTAEQYKNAIELFTRLEPLRKKWGSGIIITSGARTREYTHFLKASGVPAATRSAHIDWQAVDLSPSNGDLVGFRKLVLGYWQGRIEDFSATPNWVHLDVRGGFGKQLIFKP